MNRPPTTFQVNGTAIREERKRQGLGIRQTAEAAGISRSYLTRLELGTRERMRPAAYVRLRTCLNTTDDQLLAPPQEPSETR